MQAFAWVKFTQRRIGVRSFIIGDAVKNVQLIFFSSNPAAERIDMGNVFRGMRGNNKSVCEMQ